MTIRGRPIPRCAMHLAAFCAVASRIRACCVLSEGMLRTKSMVQSRRDFLKNSGSLIIGLTATSFVPGSVRSQGPFATHPSHVDPNQLGSWLAVNADGSITAYTGKCDFGQGIFTAQTQLVAEELCVPVARVKLVQCDTD